MKISVWERIKRVVAHSFNLETKQEIHERIEKKKEEQVQHQLRLQHEEHIKQLMLEYREQIAVYEEERKLQKQREEEEKRERLLQEQQRREMEEKVRLYKDNRQRQQAVIYREVSKDVFEVVSVHETPEQ
jgi:hypothetical protein